MEKIVEFINVYRTFETNGIKINASCDLNFCINKGELAIIVGPSGSGKTTLLNLLGGMDRVTSGSIIVDGQDITKYNDKKLTSFRRNSIGFVFQFYNLIPNLTALDNVELSNELVKNSLPSIEALKMTGLEERVNNFPSQLSGGEQQRVAIARAIAKNPKLLLCDEPTGALDYQTGKMILKVLSDIARINSQTVVIITHNSALTKMGDHVIHIKNGSIEKEEYNSNPIPIEDIEW